MRKLIFFFIFLLITTVASARNYGANPVNKSSKIKTDTSQFAAGKILTASNTTVQSSLEQLNQYASSVTAILQCETSDPFCFQYTPTTLTLYMSSNQVHDWTVTLADQFLLLETGDYLLLETGDKLVLE